MKIEVVIRGVRNGGLVADALSPDNAAEGLEISIRGGDNYVHVIVEGRTKSVRAAINDIFRSLTPILHAECVRSE